MKHLFNALVVVIGLILATHYAPALAQPALGAYTAKVAMMPVGADPEAPTAELSYIAYTLDGADPETRPITFLFNGGPGASSVYLHIGVVGPMTIDIPGDGSLPSISARLEENPYTWLHFTDLVFIDPVGTGYSRVLPKADGSPGDPKAYYEVEADLRSFTQFMRRYIGENDRWLSPKAIAGESYGGMRVAALSKMLMEEYDINLSRAVLISPALRDKLTDPGERYAVLHYMSLLPSQVATAAVHGLNGLPGDTQGLAKAIAEVERFAMTDFVTGLVGLGRAKPEETMAFYERVAQLTGLDASLVAFHRGRIDANTYARNLFRKDYKILDRYDSTQASADPVPESEVLVTFDRSLMVLNGVLSGPFFDYLNNILDYQTERRYNLLSFAVNAGWNRSAALGAPDDLAYALTLNRDLKALVVHGYHDLITPYFLSRYLLEQSVVSDTARKRLYFGTYRGGHMFYFYDESRAEFFKDVSGFYAN